MERLTTDTPKNNRESLLNYAYAKDGRVYLSYADGEENVDLCEYLASQSCKECEMTAEAIMDGGCMECDCIVAILNAVAVQAAELRARLKAYEDTGLKPEDLRSNEDIDFARVVELLRADAEGRLVTFPCKVGDEVWGIRNYRGVKHPQRGRVNDMFFTRDMQLRIVVKHICHGTWGKNVFPNMEAAEAALQKEEP